MRALLLSSLLLAGCTGNWSNDDLEYAAALPSRDTLRSQLPTAGSTMQGIRKDPLGLGEPSQSYKDTRGASDQFNGIVDFITTVLDAVVKYPPTSRTKDSRTWGPWDDNNNPGQQFRVVITRSESVDFGWQIDTGARGTELKSVAKGHYRATDAIKKGEGDFTVDTKLIRETSKSTDELNPVDAITVVYDTRDAPKLVDMTFAFAPGGQSNLSSAGYSYLEEADKSGSMQFVTHGLDPNATEAHYDSKWVKTGAGGVRVTITEGLYRGAIALECWDDDFNTVYVDQNWLGGIKLGAETACALTP